MVSLKDSLVEFYKLHHNKGKVYTYKQWKNSSLSKTSIYRILTRFDEEGTTDEMFDNLKAKIHSANENGLSSLL